MAFLAAEYAVTATATSISAALGARLKQKHCKQIRLQLADGATEVVYGGQSDVTVTTNRGFSLVPTTGVQPKVFLIDSATGHISTDDIFLIGTVGAANIVFITLVY